MAPADDKQELLARVEAAQALVRAKSRFFAAASHDLRQPLYAMTLLIDALREQALAPEALSMVATIGHSAQELVGAFTALLDLSKLDAGLIEAHPSYFPAQRLLDQLSQQFAPRALEKNLSLRVHPSVCWLQSDPVLLGRLLEHLLSNALHHTESGEVELGLRRTRAGLRVEVRDTGPGITAADRAHLFDENWQLENPRQRSQGLHLDLAIASLLARLLGDSIEVSSVPGRGSCFAFSLAHCPPEPGC